MLQDCWTGMASSSQISMPGGCPATNTAVPPAAWPRATGLRLLCTGKLPGRPGREQTERLVSPTQRLQEGHRPEVCGQAARSLRPPTPVSSILRPTQH